MPSELEHIQEQLNRMQDLIEVVSFQQRKMQITDDKLVRQTARINQFEQILRTVETKAD
jgi:Fic family protein